MEKEIVKDGIVYNHNSTYYVAGARSALDNVPVGLYGSYDSCKNDWPNQSSYNFIREATQLEINNFFGINN